MGKRQRATWSSALVTGASSGIGQEIARQLAVAGTNLVLVARDRERLQEQATRYADRYGVTVEVLAADLLDPSQLACVETRVRRLAEPIDLLVNNAAFGTNGLFHELSIGDEQREIALNVVAPVRLTHAALGRMKQSRRGTILNISSISGLLPGPRMATYAATKAYVSSFTESLHEELRGTGVSVTAVHPGFTRTEFQQRAGMQEKVDPVPSMLWMSASRVAADALSAAQKKKVLSAPGGYGFVAGVLGILPRSVKRVLSRHMKQ